MLDNTQPYNQEPDICNLSDLHEVFLEKANWGEYVHRMVAYLLNNQKLADEGEPLETPEAITRDFMREKSLGQEGTEKQQHRLAQAMVYHFVQFAHKVGVPVAMVQQK